MYEAPHHMVKLLEELSDVQGDRKMTLCRELTKLNEEILRTTIAKAVELYAETDPRGEYVLVVEGAKDVPAEKDGYPEDPGKHVQALMESGMDRMDAIKSAAKERSMSKGAFYKLLLGASEEE